METRPQVAAAVAARYAQGTPWLAMEAEFDLTTRTLCILMREAGSEPNRGFGRSRKSPTPIPIGDAAAAYNNGATIRQVAKRLGRSYGSVHAALSACPDVRLRTPGPKRTRSYARVNGPTGSSAQNGFPTLESLPVQGVAGTVFVDTLLVHLSPALAGT